MSSPCAGDPEEAAARRERRFCILFLLLNAALRFATAAGLPLLNEETYYWEWSRFPAAGYLDHPPMTAWLIAAATAPWPGGGALAVRLPALLLGAGTQALIFRLALTVTGDRRTAWRALLASLGLPLLTANGVLMATESPQVFFHLLALTLLAGAARRRGGTAAWLGGGAALGLALLSNFIAALALPALGAWIATAPRTERRRLVRGGLLALLAAAAVAAPFLWWNAGRGWPTFALQMIERHRQELRFGLRRPAEWVFEQLVNTGPILFVPLFLALRRRTGTGDAPAALPDLLRGQSLAILAVMFAVGATAQTHPNWTLLAYPPVAILLAVSASRTPGAAVRFHRVAGAAAVMAHALLAIVLTCFLPAARAGLHDSGEERSKVALAGARLLGWPAVATEAERRRALEPDGPGGPALLFGADFRFSSPVSFQRWARPAEDRVVVNLGPYVRARRAPGDAQVLYLPAAARAGRSGLLIVRPREYYVTRLCALFESAEELEPLRQVCGGRCVVEYRVFRVTALLPCLPYPPEPPPAPAP